LGYFEWLKRVGDRKGLAKNLRAFGVSTVREREKDPSLTGEGEKSNILKG